MNQPLQKPDEPDTPAQLPADLSASTVSEIALWLVGQPLDAVEREMIRHTLESCGGDRALAASVLGISLPNLRKKIRAYSVRGEALPESFEQPREIPQAENDGTLETVSAGAESALGATNENFSGSEASEAVIETVPSEPESTLAVPEPDNDPRLTLVETETVSEPAVVQAEPEIAVAPAAKREIILAGAAVTQPAEAVVETPKLIAGIATPRTKQKTNFTGPLLAGMLTLLLAAPIAYGVLSTQEKSKEVDIDRNRLQATSIETPRFEQRIQVPVWATRPARAETVMPVDIAADRRAPVAAAPVAPVVVAESAPAAASEMPAVAEVNGSAGVPSPQVAEESAPEIVQTVHHFNPEFGSEMDLGPVNIAADVAMDLGPVNRLADVAMDLGPVNRLADLRMELWPVDIAADTRMELGPVNVLADVRMEFIGAPEITGSIPVATFFVAPKSVPSPVVRGNPDVPVRRAVAPRPARAAPAQAEQPSATEPFPLLFPFSLFAPKNAQTGAATTVSSPQPVDCCIQ